MIVPFLRGARVWLAVGEAAPLPTSAEATWLVSEREEAPYTREVHALLADATGARCGVASLAPISWEAHEARVALHAARGADVAEALALLTRYAAVELNLDAVWAEPASPDAERLLASAGWRRDGERRWTWRR